MTTLIHKQYRGIDIQKRWLLEPTDWMERRLCGLVDFCHDNVKPMDVLLELGRSRGASTSIFAEFAHTVISVEIDELNIQDAMWLLQDYHNVVLIQHDSTTVHEIFGPNLYDVLYIDAKHRYPNVLTELQTLTPLARPTAIIGGHDYQTGWLGVKRAVDEFFGTPPDKVYKDCSWAYKWESCRLTHYSPCFLDDNR